MTKTVWRQVIDLYESDDADWTVFEPEIDIRGVQCYCVGGGLAKVITGTAVAMYSNPLDEDFSPELDAVLGKLADYVGVSNGGRYGTRPNYKRVYQWNDSLPEGEGKATVLKTLAELDALEKSK